MSFRNHKPLSLPAQLLKEIGAPKTPRKPEHSRINRRVGRKESSRSNLEPAGGGIQSNNKPQKQPKSFLEKRKRLAENESDVEDASFRNSKAEQSSSDKNKRQRVVSRAVREKLAEDDAEINDLERKLRLKSRKSLPKEFRDDGLDGLLDDIHGLQGDGIGSASKNDTSHGAREWLAHKRNQAIKRSTEHPDDFENHKKLLRSEPLDADNSDDSAYLSLGDVDEEFSGGSDVQSSEGNSCEGFESEDNHTSRVKRERENPYIAPATTHPTRNIPKPLRENPTEGSNKFGTVYRQTRGIINRLTESNLNTTLIEIEKLYRDNPRHHISSSLVDLVMAQVADPVVLPDTFLVLNAGFLASLHKMVGSDFSARFLQQFVTRFQEEHVKASHPRSVGGPPFKETSNLITLLCEMYIFQVISSNLIFDYVRLLLADLSELNAELLLRIVRMAGPMLRKDDPLSLKDIVGLIRPAIARVGESNLSVRTKFMIETINDLKNNKLKAGSQQSAVLTEHVTRMKKILGSLSSKNMKASEPFCIGLDDIKQADIKGKWWMVGASWSGISTEIDVTATKDREYSDKERKATNKQKILAEDELGQSEIDLSQLAREQGMNTRTRQAIFVAIVGAADPGHAYHRIRNLRLSKRDQREIPTVLIRCVGGEEQYNPYYSIISKKFCQEHQIKFAFQDCLWKYFRRLGESLFGDNMDEDDDEYDVDMRRNVNVAKFFGSLVADNSLNLGILKCLNLAELREMTSIFVEVMIITTLRECMTSTNKSWDIGAASLTKVFGINGLGTRVDLASSLQYFMKKRVRKSDLAESKEAEQIKSACKAAEAALAQAIAAAVAST
jgi:nucleolar MIF4G domain-containing protein 1